MKHIVERIAATVASLVLLGLAWYALFELLVFGWRA